MWRRFRRSLSIANTPKDQPKQSDGNTLSEYQFQKLEREDSQDSFDEENISEPSSPYFNDPLGVNRAKRRSKYKSRETPKTEVSTIQQTTTTPESILTPIQGNAKSRSTTPSQLIPPQMKKCPICSFEFPSAEGPEITTHVEDCVKKMRQTLIGNRRPRAILTTITSSSLPNVITQAPITITTQTNHHDPGLRSSSFPPAPRTRQIPHSSSSFVIKCPYPNCFQSLEPWDFFSHATRLHKKDPQNFSCPICAVENGNYRISSNTHLLNHLNNHHYEEVTDDSESTQRSSTMDSNDSDEENFTFSTKLGSSYLEDTIKEHIPGTECLICFDEFFEGDKIARLECFCIFHKNCIDKWFQKKNKCPLHID